MRAGKPILALTDPIGDTAGVLREAGLNGIVKIDSAEEIAVALPAFVRDWRSGQVALPSAEVVRTASRQGRSIALAAMLDGIGRA